MVGGRMSEFTMTTWKLRVVDAAKLANFVEFLLIFVIFKDLKDLRDLKDTKNLFVILLIVP